MKVMRSTPAHSRSGSAAPRRARRVVRDVGLAAAGLGAGAALTLVVPGWLSEDAADVVLPVPRSESVGVDAGQAPTAADVVGAGSAVAAVERFLAAEQARALETSFELLGDMDRREIPDTATWVAVHADVLPPIQSYEVGEVQSTPDGVAVTSTIEFEPSLDEFRGLTPGTARVAWHVTQDANGWRVSLGRSTFEPVYPDEAQVLPAAQRWLDVAPCDPAAAAHPNVTFLGSRRDLLRDLCEQSGSIAGGVSRLDDQRVRNDLTAAFGSDVERWARIVTVDGPVPSRLVLAPVGDEWTVVDVIGAGAS